MVSVLTLGLVMNQTCKFNILSVIFNILASHVLQVYYFQMYLALVLLGFLHGLVFLPVSLLIFPQF